MASSSEAAASSAEGSELAYWRFDAIDDETPSAGLTADVSGNGIHLTKVGSPGSSASIDPKFGTGYDLDGVDDSLRSSDSRLLITGDMALVLAFEWDDQWVDDEIVVWGECCGNETPESNWAYGLRTTNANHLLYAHEGGNGVDALLESTRTIERGLHIVTLTRDTAAKVVTVKLDGLPVIGPGSGVSGSYGVNPSGGTAGELRIARDPISPEFRNWNLNGAVHELRLWDELVPQATLDAIAARSPAFPWAPRVAEGTESGLWYMDAQDDNAPSAGLTADASGNALHLTKLGSPARRVEADAKFGTGYNFDDGDDGLRTADAALAIAGNLSVTMAFEWDAQGAEDQLFVWGGDGETFATNSFYSLRTDTANHLAYAHEYGAGTNVLLTSVATVRPGLHVLTLQRDATLMVVRVTLDGVPVIGPGSAVSGSYANAPEGGTSADFRVGRNPTTSFEYPFNGGVHELRVWDHLLPEATLVSIAAASPAPLVTPWLPRVAEGTEAALWYFDDLDDNAPSAGLTADASGSGLHLTKVGSPARRVEADAKFGTGYDFDDVDDNLQTNASQLAITSDLSIVIAFEWDAQGTADALVDWGGQGETMSGNLLYGLRVASTNKPYYFHESGAGVDTALWSDTAMRPGFHVLTLRRDATAQVVTLTLDGEPIIGSGSTVSGAYGSNAQGGTSGYLSIGHNPDNENVNYWLNGAVHEVRVWDHLVSESTLASIAAATPAPPLTPWLNRVPEGTEAALWYFDDLDDNAPSAGLTADASGNARHLTKLGVPARRASTDTRFAGGYDFDGTDDGLRSTDTALALTDSMSAIAAFEYDGQDPRGEVILRWVGDPTSSLQSQNILHSLHVDASNKLGYVHERGSGILSSIVSTATVSFGPHTVTLQRDATALVINVKLDGVPVIGAGSGVSGSYAGNPDGGLVGAFIVGRNEPPGTARLNGAVHEIRLWDRLVPQATLDSIALATPAARIPWAPRQLEGTEVGAWFMDDEDDTTNTTLDASGHTLDLTKLGTPARRTSPEPKYGRGYDADGSDDDLRSNASALALTGNMSAFAAFERDVLGSGHVLFRWVAAPTSELQSNNALYSLGIDASNRVEYWHERDGGVNTVITSTATVGTGPHTLTLVRDATALVINVDVDGVPVIGAGSTVSGSYTGPNGGTEGLLHVAVAESGAANNGAVYEVRIWDRVVPQSTLDAIARASTRPSSPTALVAVPALQAGCIALSWAPPADVGDLDVTYRVHRSSSQGPNGTTDVGATLAHTQCGLGDNAEWSFRVSAVNARGESARTQAVTASTGDLPDAAQNITARRGAIPGRVDVDWEEPLSNGSLPILGYSLRVETGTGTFDVLLTDLSVGTLEAMNLTYDVLAPFGLSHGDGNLTNNETRNYSVAALNDVGLGEWSPLVSGTAPDVPGLPRLLVAARGDALGEIDVSWETPLSNGGLNVTGFVVRRDGGLTVNLSGDARAWTDSGLDRGSVHNYTIAAANAAGLGAWASLVWATAPDVASAPRTAAALRGNALGEIDLTWQSPLENGGLNVTSYLVARDGVEVANLTVGTNAWTDTVLDACSWHNYTIGALNAAGLGELASVAPAPVQAPCVATAPRAFASARASPLGSINLTWQSPLDGGGLVIDSYIITRDGDLAANLSSSANAWSDSGLELASVHDYTIGAFNAAGLGALAPITDAVASGAPGVVGSLTSNPTARGDLTVSWSAPSDNGGVSILGYHVVRPGAFNVTLSAANRTFIDRNLLDNTTYLYEIVPDNGVTGPVRNATGQTFGVPYPPRSLATTGLDHAIKLTWSIPSVTGGGVTGYEVIEVTEQGPIQLANLTAAQLSYTHVGLGNNESHAYEVVAWNAIGPSNPASVTGRTLRGVPTAPRLPQVSATGVGELTLTWAAPLNDGGDPILRYHVGVAPTIGGTYAWRIVEGPTPPRMHVEGGLGNGATACFVIEAENVAGVGPRSVGVCGLTWRAPDAPPSFTATAGAGAGEITLAWGTPAGGGIRGYLVERADSASGPWGLLSDNTTSPHVDRDLGNGVTWWYRVRAFNDVGEGANAAAKTARTFSPPSTPQGLTASPNAVGTIGLSWGAPADLGGHAASLRYRVETWDTTIEAWVALDDNATSRSIAHSGLGNGQTRDYRVFSWNIAGTSTWPANATATTWDVPNAPRLVVAQAGPGPGQIRIDWEPPERDGGTPVTAYTVHRVNDTGALPIATLGAAARTFIDSNLSEGEHARYVVTAGNVVGYGPASTEAEATAFRRPGQQLRPTGESGPAEGELTFRWRPPADEGGTPIIGYLVNVTVPDGTTQLYDMQSTNLSLTLRVGAGQTREARVLARNIVGDGPYSDPATAVGAGLASTTPDAQKECQTFADAAATCTDGSERVVLDVAAGMRHTCVLLDGGDVDCYGNQGDASSNPSEDRRGIHARAIFAGGDSTCAVLPNATAFCWGSFKFGKAQNVTYDVKTIALGDRVACYVSLDDVVTCRGVGGLGLTAFNGRVVTGVTAGDAHVCILNADGSVECRGNPSAGAPPQGLVAKSISAGRVFTCALTLTDRVVCWGDIDWAATTSAVDGQVASIAAGARHVCARLGASTVRCFGDNSEHQSDGDAGGDATRVVSGGFHSCALTTSLRVRCWGADRTGTGGLVFNDQGQSDHYPRRLPTV